MRSSPRANKNSFTADVCPQGTLQDYQEMFIQFGYVVLFSSAFPLAAMCALINNIIEIRSDALKLCTSLQRPFGLRVENIGQWQVRNRSWKMPEKALGPHRSPGDPLSLSADCDGGHGSDSHNSELLFDRSVRAAPASVPMAESRDDHRLHRLTGGRAQCGVCTSRFVRDIFSLRSSNLHDLLNVSFYFLVDVT